MDKEEKEKLEKSEMQSDTASETRGNDKKGKKKKPKVVYYEDKGETIYSMAALNGRTPEEQEEYDKKRKNPSFFTRGERMAAISAAFSVYGPMLLCMVSAFALAALFMYLFLK